jgi:predicted regulator of Ras-like GTPase activity (Roadblock/LC7/MglB family)
MSVRVTQDIAKTLSKELHTIVNEAEIDTLGIITVTGARVAFFTKTNADSSELSAISAAMVNSSNLAVMKLEFGELSDVMLRGTGGFLILRSLSDRFLLVGGTKKIETFTKAAKVLVSHGPLLAEILKDIPDEMY